MICKHCGAGQPCNLSSWCRHPDAWHPLRYGEAYVDPADAGRDFAWHGLPREVFEMQRQRNIVESFMFDARMLALGLWPAPGSTRRFIAQPDLHPLAE